MHRFVLPPLSAAAHRQQPGQRTCLPLHTGAASLPVQWVAVWAAVYAGHALHAAPSCSCCGRAPSICQSSAKALPCCASAPPVPQNLLCPLLCPPCCSAPFTRRWTTRMCGPTTSASTLRWRSPSLCPPSRRRPPSRHGSGWLPRRYACPRPAAAAADRACLPGLLPAALQILPSLSLIMHPVLAGGQVEVHRGQAGHR